MDQYDQVEAIFSKKIAQLEDELRKAATGSAKELTTAAFRYTEMLQFSQDFLYVLENYEKDVDLRKVDPAVALYEAYSNEMSDRDVTMDVIWDVLEDIAK